MIKTAIAAPSLLKKVSFRQSIRFEIDGFEGKAYRNNAGTVIVNIGCQSHPLSWWRGRDADTIIASQYDAEVWDTFRYEWEPEEEFNARVEERRRRADENANKTLKLLLAREEVLNWIEAQLS